MSSELAQPPAIPATLEIHGTIVRTLAGKAVSVPAEGSSTEMAIRASGHSLLSLLDQVEAHYADALEHWGGDLKDYPLSSKAIRDLAAAKVEVINALKDTGTPAKKPPGKSPQNMVQLAQSRTTTLDEDGKVKTQVEERTVTGPAEKVMPQ